MRHVPEKYRELLRSKKVIETCLLEAHARFPDDEISFCGVEQNWEDCLGAFYIDPTDKSIRVLFFFNVGADTKTLAVNLLPEEV